MSAEQQRVNDLPLFQFKNSRVAMNELVLLETDLAALEVELARHAQKLPSLFQQMPVILNLEKLPEAAPTIDLARLALVCRQADLNPIGVRGSHYSADELHQAGLCDLGKSRKAQSDDSATNVTELHSAKQETAQPVEEPEVEPAGFTSQTRVVTTPVRSGQQIYVRGGDLIILSSVSPGAEVMADGNIHVYGSLRGRAMAGVSGDEDARIFCQSLEAELISIAGFFKACEDLQSNLWQKPAQAYLSGTRLDTAPL